MIHLSGSSIKSILLGAGLVLALLLHVVGLGVLFSWLEQQFLDFEIALLMILFIALVLLMAHLFFGGMHVSADPAGQEEVD